MVLSSTILIPLVLGHLTNQYIGAIIGTQGNYAIRDSSGMCHFKPRRHLQEWREKEEQAFVHCGNSGLNHAIALQSFSKCHPSLYSDSM